MATSKKKTKTTVTTKGTTLPEVTVSATANPRRLNAAPIEPLPRATALPINAPTTPLPTTPPRINIAVKSPRFPATIADGPYSRFLQQAALKSTIKSKDLQIQVQKGITKSEAVAEVDFCNLISYFLMQSLPSGSNIETQFKKVKKDAQDILDQIQETEEQILHFPIKKGSIAPPAGVPGTSGSSNTANTNTLNSPQPTNLAASNSNYGGGGQFYSPSSTPAGVASTSGNNGTSAGKGITVDDSLQAIRKVKEIIEKFNIPEPVLKILPGGAALVESLKRINQDVPTNMSNFPQEDIRRLYQTFADTKELLNGIANAENPADLLKVIGAKSAIQKLEDILNPKQLIPILTGILTTVQSINIVISQLNDYIGKLAKIANLLTTVANAFIIIAKFIRKMPLPNMWTTAGVTSTLSNIGEKMDYYARIALFNLKATTEFLNSLSFALDGLVRRIAVLIEVLQYLLNKLQKCDKTKNLPITKKLKEEILTLENSLLKLQNSLPKKPTNKSITYKGYNLSIVEEEVTDSGINLTRRYGIVTDKRGVLVLQSDLTYANNTDIIYNELKYLIDRDGLNADVNASTSTSETDALAKSLDIPTEAEQNAELATTQAEINDALNQIQPIKNMKDKQDKRDSRRIKRLKRIIKRLKDKGFTKDQIKNKAQTKAASGFAKRYTNQEFEDAWNDLYG
jgi:hypothetical protein